MNAQNIEVVNLIRGTAEEDGPWVSGGGHRVHAPWAAAECEVKARVLRSLAARSTPPDGVAFVREWETPEIPHLDKLATTRCSFSLRGSQCERANGHPGACVSQNVTICLDAAEAPGGFGVTATADVPKGRRRGR